MMHVAIVTAGGAGMFCGSCMHDNVWARALLRAGHQVTLLPMYTPIRVDDADLSLPRVFYGGINVYLDQHVPGYRHLPRWLTRWIDAPWLIRAATRWGISNDARELGELTVAMLQGPDGPQAKEGDELLRYLTHDLRPDVICFSNVMLCGEVPRLKSQFSGPVLVVLQGDDVFLDSLVEPYRTRVFAQLQPIVRSLDGCLVHSRFYGEFMQGYLQIPPEKLHALPLAIDLAGHTGRPAAGPSSRTIGYFARLAPEKGLQELADAAVLLNARRQDFRLVAGGYAPPQHEAYRQEVFRRLLPLGDRFRYAGSPESVAEKSSLLQSYSVLSVPAPYREPKGLYVLEAWANGVPVVMPNHGHFPELVEATGGGLCVPAGDPQALADGLDRLLTDDSLRQALGTRGWEQVRVQHSLERLARETAAVLEQVQQRQ